MNNKKQVESTFTRRDHQHTGDNKRSPRVSRLGMSRSWVQVLFNFFSPPLTDPSKWMRSARAISRVIDVDGIRGHSPPSSIDPPEVSRVGREKGRRKRDGERERGTKKKKRKIERNESKRGKRVERESRNDIYVCVYTHIYIFIYIYTRVARDRRNFCCPANREVCNSCYRVTGSHERPVTSYHRGGGGGGCRNPLHGVGQVHYAYDNISAPFQFRSASNCTPFRSFAPTIFSSSFKCIYSSTDPSSSSTFLFLPLFV